MHQEREGYLLPVTVIHASEDLTDSLNCIKSQIPGKALIRFSAFYTQPDLISV